MKHILIGLFGGILAGFTLFILVPTGSADYTRAEDDNFTLGLHSGVIIGLASLVGLLVYLTLTRGY